MWLALTIRRKRSGQRPALQPDVFRITGAVAAILWICGLCFGLRDVPLGQAAAMFCATAALTGVAARLALQDRMPILVLIPAGLAVAGAVLAGPQAWPIGLAGAGFGMHMLLARRGDLLNSRSAHLIFAAPVAILLMFGIPPLRGEALVLAALAAIILSIGGIYWQRWVTIPALAPVAALTSILGVVWGQGPELALIPAVLGAFGIQRMIGSNGS